MYRYLLIISIMLAVTGCLDKDPVYPDTDTPEVEMSNPTRPTTIHISGDWTNVLLRPLDSSPAIKVYDSRGNLLDDGPSPMLHGEGYIEVNDELRRFRIKRRSKHELEISFQHLVAIEYEDYEIEVSGVFNTPYIIPLRLTRSDMFEITDISFDLDTYVEYPDEDEERLVATMCYPDGYYPGESKLFFIISQVPRNYQFTLFSDDPDLITHIGASTTHVSVPSYSDDPDQRWAMRGDKSLFTGRASGSNTFFFPEVPNKVEAPRGAPGDVTINCIYRKVRFDYELTFFNPATRVTKKLPGQLYIEMPIEFKGIFTPYE